MTRDELERRLDAIDLDDEDAIRELKELAREVFDSKGGDLAQAIYAFADWQQTGYATMNEKARAVIDRNLWLEVAERVRDVIGKEPPTPCLGK